LKEAYNKSHPAYLHEHEPNVIASLLKQFFRDLPEPVLTARLMPKFEQASSTLHLPFAVLECIITLHLHYISIILMFLIFMFLNMT